MTSYTVHWWDNGAPTQQRKGLSLIQARELYQHLVAAGHHAIIADAADTWYLDPEAIPDDPESV